MKKNLLSCLFMLSAVSLVAEQTFVERMNHIFQHVNKTQIPTGLLSDFGLQLVYPYAFDGTPSDTNFVAMDTWRMLYATLFSSQVNGNISMIFPETVFDRIDSATHPSAVPLAMMHFQYNSLNEHSPYWIVDTIAEQLLEVPGATVGSLYFTQSLFAVAPKELAFETATASFVFSPNLWFQNTGRTILRKEINFNNESGWLLANWNTPVSYTFNDGGIKTIYFRLTYTNGTSYTSHTNVWVEDPNRPQRALAPPLLTRDTTIFIDSVSGVHSGGEIQIRFSTNNPTRTIRRPLIVAEGFEPSSVVRIDGMENITIENFLNDIEKLGVSSPVNSGSYFRYDILTKYDIIYLDYADGVDCMHRNAALFRQVIEWVNTNKVTDEPNVVMGLSMGGVVARIALREMEMAGVNHQTRTFISVDAPHKGANIPVGIQAAVRHFADVELSLLLIPFGPSIPLFRLSDIDLLGYAVDLLNSPATRQLLIYYVDQNGNFNHTIHNNFQTYLRNIGFPQGFQGQPIENVAISNGSAIGDFNMYPGSYIFNFSESISFRDFMSNFWAFTVELFGGWAWMPFLYTNYPQVAWNAIPGRSDFRANIRINALQNRTVSDVYHCHIYIRKRVLWILFSFNINLERETTRSTSYMIALDGAPGGRFPMPDGILGDGNGGALANATINLNFGFIPTGSSLALNNWTNLTQRITNLTPTPFCLIFVPEDNEEHVDFGSSAGFLYNLLLAEIDGEDIICGVATFSLKNPNAQTANWSVTEGFTIVSQSSTSATVGTTRSDGQSGVLTAIVDGVTLARSIQAFSWDWNSITLSGPTVLCPGSTANFNVQNLPACAEVRWTHGPGLAIQGANNQTTVRIRSTGGGIDITFPLETEEPTGTIGGGFVPVESPDRSWVRATITSPALPNPIVLTKNNIMVGPPMVSQTSSVRNREQIPSFDAINGFEDAITYHGSTVRHNNPFGITAGEWRQTAGNNVILMGPAMPSLIFNSMIGTNRNMQIVRHVNGIATMEVRLQNTCGWSNWATIEYHRGPNPPLPPRVCPICNMSPCQCGSIIIFVCPVCGRDCRPRICGSSLPIVFSPNPVSDILTIDLTQTDTDAFGAQTDTERSRSDRASEIFDIRLLNSHGMIVRQQRTQARSIQFDVSNLPEGTYYLHIEHNGEIEMHQIIVQRN